MIVLREGIPRLVPKLSMNSMYELIDDFVSHWRTWPHCWNVPLKKFSIPCHSYVIGSWKCIDCYIFHNIELTSKLFTLNFQEGMPFSQKWARWSPTLDDMLEENATRTRRERERERTKNRLRVGKKNGASRVFWPFLSSFVLGLW